MTHFGEQKLDLTDIPKLYPSIEYRIESQIHRLRYIHIGLRTADMHNTAGDLVFVIYFASIKIAQPRSS